MSYIFSPYEEEIWNRLTQYFPDTAVAGIMGNMADESTIYPYRQGGGMSIPDSWTYTQQVDNGTITESQFINEYVGYGLCMWTYISRKQGLYDTHITLQQSIGSVNVNIAWMMQELQYGYNSVYVALLDPNITVRQASDLFMTDYEAPADMSQAHKDLRFGYSQQIYDKYHGGTPPQPIPPSTKKMPFWMLLGKKNFLERCGLK